MNNRTNRYCTNCGAEVPAGADFCPNCGQAISQEEETPVQEQPPRAVPPTQEVPIQQAPPSPGPATQQPAFQPPVGGTTVAPVGPPRRGLILGGIVAAAVGFLILVVVVALAAFLFWPRSGETQTPGNGGGGGGGTEPGTGSGGGGGEVSCLEGSLSDLVQTQVGDFELDGDSVEEIPEAVEAGAVEALRLVYAKQDGSAVGHSLFAFSSADGANQWMQESATYLNEEGFEVLEEGPVEDAETGEQYGSYVLVEGETEDGTLQYMLWTNGCIEAEAFSLGNDNAVDFFNSSPY